VGVSNLINNRPQTLSFLLRGFATQVIGIIDGFSVPLCCLFADKAQPSLFFTRRQMSFRMHGHALQYAQDSVHSNLWNLTLSLACGTGWTEQAADAAYPVYAVLRQF
jgi:hypothetical protein